MHELDDGRGQIRRHVQALGRSATLVIAIVAGATALAVLLSLRTPETYRATARLVLHPDASALNSDMFQRQLTTDNELVTSPTVLRRAAHHVPGMTVHELRAQINSSVSPKANLIEITASAGQAARAAAVANAVADTFLAERARSQRADVAGQRDIIEQQVRRLRALGPGPNAGSGELRALRRRLDDLAVNEAGAGSDLRLAEAATPPSDPSSPRPLLAGVLAFFASLAIAVLVALGREQLTPRAADPRDVGRILRLPVLAAIPSRKRRKGARARLLEAAERDAFQSLRTAVEMATAPGQQKVIVVTSAAAGEGKTTVAYRLAKSLVSAGQNVMLVSGDLRNPTMDAQLGLPRAPGVSELLAGAASARRRVSAAALARATQVLLPSDPPSCGWASVAVLPSGAPPDDPAALLTSDLVSSLFAEIGRGDYEWVLVDAPPLLGPADARVFAGAADAMLLVSRLGVATLDQLRAESEELDRIEVEPLGVVVVGAPLEAAIYEPRRPPHREQTRTRTATRARRPRLAEAPDRPHLIG
jgi:non-specific protein-tyrosine kinase